LHSKLANVDGGLVLDEVNETVDVGILVVIEGWHVFLFQCCHVNDVADVGVEESDVWENG